jgi:hypothetical protein
MSKLNFLLIFLIFIGINTSFTQDLTGTWRGIDRSLTDPSFVIELISEIKQNGKKVTIVTTQKTISSSKESGEVNCISEWEGTFDGTRLKIKFKKFIALESRSESVCITKEKSIYTNINGIEKLESKGKTNGKSYKDGVISFNSGCLGFKSRGILIKDKTEKNTTDIKVEDITEKLPEEYKKREFIVTNEIIVSKPELNIFFWDKNKEDGDQISVYLNEKNILKKHTITKKKEHILCQLKKGDNYIIVNADNLGEIEPNTANVSLVSEGKNLMDINCRSNLGKSVVIKITYE